MTFVVIRVERDRSGAVRRYPVGRYHHLRDAKARAAELNALPVSCTLGASYSVEAPDPDSSKV